MAVGLVGVPCLHFLTLLPPLLLIVHSAQSQVVLYHLLVVLGTLSVYYGNAFPLELSPGTKALFVFVKILSQSALD